MDLVTLGAALNGSAEQTKSYVEGHFVAGTNIQIDANSDGTQTISATGEVSSEDTYARTEIANHIADEANPHSVTASQVGLGNVTNDAQVKKISSAVSGDIVTWSGTGGDTVADSGVAIETSITDSDTKVPTSKAVNTALASKQNTIDSSHKLSAELIDNSTPVFATAAQGTKADSAIQTVKVNDTALTPTSAKAVNITVPTQASDINALPNTTKYAAALLLTIDSSTYVVTGQLKDQNGDNIGTAQTIDLPLESVVVGGSYDSQTKKVILTLQNGNTIEFSVADLVSGLQTELSATNKLDPSFINYDSTHAAVTDSDKTTWSGKQNALTFDGTYSASTNKAATVSTVTNAINVLNVTGESGISASKTISAWSETGGKVSVSTQDIAIAGTQATLTGYAKSGTAGQAVAATDNVNQAIGKLEATVDDNKTNISKDEAALVELVDNGAKNICKFVNYQTNAMSNITITNNADGSFTFNGTTGSNAGTMWYDTVISNREPMVAYGSLPDTKTTLRIRNTSNVDIAVDSGEGAVFTPTDITYRILIRLSANLTYTNYTIKPMICTKAAWDISHAYQPYRPSYQELYDMVKALQPNQ